MILIGIDQGPVQSGLATFDPETLEVRVVGVLKNEEVLNELRIRETSMLVIERFINRGFPINDDVRDAILWGGRFIQRYEDSCGGHVKQMTNREWVYRLTGEMKARDTHVRNSVVSVFGRGSNLGEKKCERCKGKRWVGKLHDECPDCEGTGIGRQAGVLSTARSHAWDALGMALSGWDELNEFYLDNKRKAAGFSLLNQ
ncbi:MAG: hypothetical protein EOM12_03405 [Verrucomicrobiae bacterium]|nr:hypothetical protein [Verrucomicrobiae bacterium]